MSHFTELELKELEAIFELKRKDNTAPVRDGIITRGDSVWWRHVDGPELVDSNIPSTWNNILAYPELYQKGKPLTLVTYKN